MKETVILSSGKYCQLIPVNKSILPFYYVLAFPITQNQPSKEEVAEMMNIGVEHAKKLAKKVLGDEEAYSLLYSGYSARREKGWRTTKNDV